MSIPKLMRLHVSLLFSIVIGITVASAQPTSAWKTIGSMQTERTFGALHQISPTEMIIVGVGTSTDIINVANGTVVSGPMLSHSRYQFTSSVDENGRIFVFGGNPNGGNYPVEMFDPVVRLWRTVGSIENGSWQSYSAYLGNGDFIIVGGRNGESDVIATCEIYNSTSQTSRSIAPFPYETSFSKVIVTGDHHILCFSGRSGGPGSFRTIDIHEYIIESDSWLKAGECSVKTYYPTITKLLDGRWLMTGGSEEESNGPDTYQRTVAYLEGTSFVNGERTLLSNRCGHGATQVSDEWVIVTGGDRGDKQGLASCEWINVKTGEVKQGPSLSNRHAFHNTLSIFYEGNSYTVVAGGSTTANVELLTVSGVQPNQPCDPLVGRLNLLTRDNIHLRGSAAWNTGDIPGARLTAAETMQVGAAWSKTLLDVSKPFATNFSFVYSGGNDADDSDGGNAGSDGIALVFHTSGLEAQGSTGMGLGYEGINNAVAVEFDAHKDAACSDPAPSHIAVQAAKGTSVAALHQSPYLVGMTSQIPDFVSGQTYYGKVAFTGSRLLVYLRPTPELGEPVLVIPNFKFSSYMNIDAANKVFYGFTGATRLSYQRQDLITWSLNNCIGDTTTSVVDAWAGDVKLESLIVSPQPADHTVEVTVPAMAISEGTSDFSLVIVDVTGRVCYQTAISLSSGHFAIATDNLVSGWYTVLLTDGKRAYSQTLSVTH